MRYLLYCIFRSQEPQRFETICGVGGHRILQVSHRHLNAVLSPVGSEELEADIPRLLAYEKVIEAFHRQYTIIPMRYGCLFDELSQVVSLLKERRRQYELLLRDLEGCVEMGIRILLRQNTHDSGPVLGEKAGADPVEGRAPGPGRNPGRTGLSYLAGQRKRYAARDEEARGRGLIAARVLSAFEGLFFRHRQEFRVMAGCRLVSLYFLVPRNLLESFRRIFSQVSASEMGKFLLSGPWPPYNFVLSKHLGNLHGLK